MRLKAFTLLEVLIALAILSIGFLAVLRGSTFNLRSSRVAADLSVAVMAAESLIKEEIANGFPQSGTDEGVFEDGIYQGYAWSKSIEVLELPFIEELKLVTVTVSWEENRNYTLRTVLSRY